MRLVFSYIKLSGKPITAPDNLAALLFFGTLMVIGYTSVVITVYEMVNRVTHVGYRPDLEPLV